MTPWTQHAVSQLPSVDPSFTVGVSGRREPSANLSIYVLVTITLIPTSRSRDPVGPRVLVLGPGNYNAVVGRSSKVESKNLVPAEDNGWFDNRVMSRAHAEFTAIPKFQVPFSTAK